MDLIWKLWVQPKLLFLLLKYVNKASEGQPYQPSGKYTYTSLTFLSIPFLLPTFIPYNDNISKSEWKICLMIGEIRNTSTSLLVTFMGTIPRHGKTKTKKCINCNKLQNTFINTSLAYFLPESTNLFLHIFKHFYWHICDILLAPSGALIAIPTY